jgi:hypothetical protein
MSFDPSEHVDEIVTVLGTALTARAGAMVSLDDATPLYVAGLTEWSEEMEDTRVEVTGVLRRLPSRLPKVPPGGPHSHGVGERLALEDASWKPAV